MPFVLRRLGFFWTLAMLTLLARITAKFSGAMEIEWCTFISRTSVAMSWIGHAKMM